MSKTFFIAGSTGATGSKAAQYMLEKGHKVRAFVHKNDERSAELTSLGAEIITGDLLDFRSVRCALDRVDAAYFVYPIAPGQRILRPSRKGYRRFAHRQHVADLRTSRPVRSSLLSRVQIREKR